MPVTVGSGGYDEGYRSCPCFWGLEPGSLVSKLSEFLPDVKGMSVIDAGCGEGKNAAFFGRREAVVRAFDVSEIAIDKAKILWHDLKTVSWEVADIRQVSLPADTFDIVVAYGLLHCLNGTDEIIAVIKQLMNITKPGGYNVICSFNNIHQELEAHPGFHPTLLPHALFVDSYSDWKMLFATDNDLIERHPHNNIEHIHSMTRIIAQKAGV